MHQAEMKASTVVGLDIGGANLKVANSDGAAFSQAFPLWKNPDRLTAAIRDLVAKLPNPDVVAATMTGELCDCFASKEEGVRHILTALSAALPGKQILVWRNDGRFVEIEAAGDWLLSLAAANWLALASFAGRLTHPGNSIVVDMGSTTTDIIPLKDGIPCPVGRSDLDRIRSCELVYVGISRTPVCALLGPPFAAELFATTRDVYLVLGMMRADAADTDTADGRPATVACAQSRLARMLCADPAQLSDQELLQIAVDADSKLRQSIGDAVARVAARFSCPPASVMISGAGEFRLRQILADIMHSSVRIVSLEQELGPELSSCACAYAVAMLAREQLHEA
jgi:probable H4MPT-linked C1 transfer pathway protein